jgi:energy-coupling factor transport system ATP-binding protein
LLLRELADKGMAVIIIEHRIEDVLALHPEHCLYMTSGSITYDGDADGLLQSVDWHQIKLPAPIVMQRVRKTGALVAPKLSPRVTVDTPQAPLLTFRKVGFRYADGPEVLHDISFTIHRGDIIAVIGANGAGKSTFLKHAIGLNRPSTGQVSIGKQDSKTLTVAQMARTVGFVFQSPSHMLFAPTVREELGFGPANVGISKEITAVNTTRALAAVNLSGIEDESPLAQSFGQQKRISIASILTMNPRIIILDEPTAGQDHANAIHFMDDIVNRVNATTGAEKDMQSSIEALAFITHDLDLAITYANRIVLVSDGRIIADGPPELVLSDTARLIACRVVPTSLLEANLAVLNKAGRFLSAEQLAFIE